MVSLYYSKTWAIKIDWLTCLFQIENLSACKLSTHVPKFAFLAAEFLLTCCLVSTLHNRLLSAGSKVCSTQCCWLVLDMQYILRLCSHHVCIDHVCIHFACTYHQWIHHECLHHAWIYHVHIYNALIYHVCILYICNDHVCVYYVFITNVWIHHVCIESCMYHHACIHHACIYSSCM